MLQEASGQRAGRKGPQESSEFPRATGWGAVGEDREVIISLSPMGQILFLLPF